MRYRKIFRTWWNPMSGSSEKAKERSVHPVKASRGNRSLEGNSKGRREARRESNARPIRIWEAAMENRMATVPSAVRTAVVFSRRREMVGKWRYFHTQALIGKPRRGASAAHAFIKAH